MALDELDRAQLDPRVSCVKGIYSYFIFYFIFNAVGFRNDLFSSVHQRHSRSEPSFK
jgi:hypothetical protein